MPQPGKAYGVNLFALIEGLGFGLEFYRMGSSNDAIDFIELTDAEILARAPHPSKAAYELVVIKLKSPSAELFEHLQALHRSNRSLRSIIVLQKGDEKEIEAAFAAGAHDVLVEPVSPTELKVKAKRARRSFSVFELSLIFGSLTMKEGQILTALSLAPDYRCTRQQLMHEVWGDHPPADNRCLNVHLFNLRKKIRQFGFDVHSTRMGELTLKRI
jgi:DNA-binding response OmpR family regulator